MASIAVGLAMAAVTANAAGATAVRIETGQLLSDVGDNFQGFTTDYWLNNGPYADKWFPNGSILLVDLEDPKFRKLVQVRPASRR